ncbi:unnamed protein product [Protopolystoma xenopodis]|uniref:Uncharacterized protein n=1 Tax=Protopolystoma xenopodis TaxID=117903 RepID=A0A3S5A509_9PLAT|nr:unnamed protein product [Protopolystoma xenopodis]
MMPLLLFAFGRFFIDVDHVVIPYGNISLQLAILMLSAVAGIGLASRWPDIARRRIRPFLTPCILIMLVFVIGVGTWLHYRVYRLMVVYPVLCGVGACLPWTGFIVSMLAAWCLLRGPRSVILTIGLETGIQNYGIALLVLHYSMPQPAGDLGSVMPWIVAFFTPIPLYLAFMARVSWRLHQRFIAHRHGSAGCQSVVGPAVISDAEYGLNTEKPKDLVPWPVWDNRIVQNS